MLGPLAPSLAVAPAVAPQAARLDPVLDAPRATTPSPTPPAEPALPERAPLTVPELATISAELGEQRAPRADVLYRHRLDEKTWAQEERRLKQELSKETSRGSTRLQGLYDEAYVAAVEGFRGPITAAEYARVVVGLERGQASAALDDLKIQRPALMSVVRLWTRKVAADPRLAAETRRLIASMRQE